MVQTAAQKTAALQRRLQARGIDVTFEQAETLRRAELTLQHWYELECGDGNHLASWGIERDETTDKPFMVTHHNRYPQYGTSRNPIPDREAGAKRRIDRVCAEIEAHFFVQGDPRGCALYVSSEPLTDSNYSSLGVACCD